MTIMSTMAKRPAFSFTHSDAVEDFTVSNRSYLATRPDASFDYIATSALVIDSRKKPEPLILLLQRAASDSEPNKWEPPGGACDDDDPSILHAAARELWEEAGLEAAHIDGLVGDPYFFSLRNGKKVCQFSFAVHVRAANDSAGVAPMVVRLDPAEHQNYVWATEAEVKAKNSGGIELRFTRDEVQRMVLLALKRSKEQ